MRTAPYGTTDTGYRSSQSYRIACPYAPYDKRKLEQRGNYDQCSEHRRPGLRNGRDTDRDKGPGCAHDEDIARTQPTDPDSSSPVLRSTSCIERSSKMKDHPTPSYHRPQSGLETTLTVSRFQRET